MTEATCICIALRRASRKITAVYDEALAPTGVNIAQFSLLRKLRRHDALSLSTLAELTELDRSTLGRNLKVLEKAGLVAIGRGNDQREAAASLTVAGQRVLTEGDPLWDGVQARMSDRLGGDGVERLLALAAAL